MTRVRSGWWPTCGGDLAGRDAARGCYHLRLVSRRHLVLLLLTIALLGASWLVLADGSSARGEGADLASELGVADVLPALGTDEVDAEGNAVLEDGGVAVQRQALARDDDPRPRVAAAEVLVLDALGRPLGGAIVRGTAAGAFDEQATGEDGRARLTLPQAATVALRAQAARHLAAGLAEHAFGQPATIRLAPAAVLVARVQDGEGVPMAQVRVSTRGRTGARGDTDAVGCVVLDGIRPGTYDLAFDGRENTASRFFLLAGVYLAPGDNRVDVALPPGQTIRGVARSSPTGTPLVDASITLSWDARAGNVGGFSRRIEARTDAAGAFAFAGVPPGSIRLRADAAGHTPIMRPLELRESRGEQQVDLELVAAAVVRGTVLDVDRSGVADAEVSFGWWGGDSLRFGPTTKTDAEGRFELLDVPVRVNAFVAAAKDGRATAGAEVKALAPGDVREGIVVELKAGVRVRGRLRSEEGTTVSGAAVRLTPRHGADRYAQAGASDGNGFFAFEHVVAFPSRVEVTAPGFVPLGVDVDVKDDKPETDLGELTLRVAHTLEGIVVARGQIVGLGAARANLSARAKDVPRVATNTDELGRFAFADLPRGEYLLDVRGPDVLTGKPMPVGVPHRGVLRVFVDPMVPLGTGVLELRVVDATTGQPMPEIAIAGIDKRRVAYADGMYSLRGVSAGQVDLQVAAKGFQAVAVPGAFVAAGQTRRLRDVLLVPATSLRVLVLDERGRPFKPAQVNVQLVDDQGLTLPISLAPAMGEASKGTYLWDALALSRFTLRVKGPPTHVPQERAVEIYTTTPSSVQLKLARLPKKPPAKKSPPQKANGR